MAALVITAAQVKADADATVITGRVGVAVTPGQMLFYEDESRLWKLASSTGTLAQARTGGAAVATSAANGTVGICTDGLLIVGAGAAPAKGTIYIQGINGAINPSADAATTWNVTILGVGDGNGGILLGINPSDQTVP